jgi:hypothetical protein
MAEYLGADTGADATRRKNARKAAALGDEQAARVRHGREGGPAAAVAASVYDLVVWNNAGTCTLTRDVAWTNVTTPAAGDAFVRVNGVLVNSVAITNGPGIGFGTYLGTVVTDAAGATVTFNPAPAAASGGPSLGAWVGLWNYYNRLDVVAVAQDSAGSWTYPTATWREADNSANNRVTFVVGQAEESQIATYKTNATGSGEDGAVGVGIDSTTVPTTIGSVQNSAVTATSAVVPQITAVGQHYAQALEYANGGNVTFYGSGLYSKQSMQVSVQLRY